MKLIVCNAFSVSMLPRLGAEVVEVAFEPISTAVVRDILDVDHAVQDELGQPPSWVSAVGHADTAAVLSNLLGHEIPVQRVNVTLDEDIQLIVAQYRGPRLPEGATELPPGATIEFWQVRRVN